VQSPDGEVMTMVCGARLQVVRLQDWQAIDGEVRDIMLRVWGVEPIQWNGKLIVPLGMQTAVERLRASVEWVRQQVEPKVLELNAVTGDAPNLNWLDDFIREHTVHEHPNTFTA